MFSTYSWYHLECGADTGRDFIRAVRDYNKTFPCKKELLKNADAVFKEEYPYFEYSPSSRSSCIVCKNKILKGNIRLSSSEYYGRTGEMRRVFSHPECAAFTVEGFLGLRERELFKLIIKNSVLKKPDDLDKVKIFLNTLNLS